MALRAKQPEVIEKRLRLFLYGPAGVGKTTAAIQFPKPYLIDCERGAENDEYVEKLKAAGGVYWYCHDPDEVITETTSLLTEKHEYKTIVIDPATVLYDRLIERGIEEKGDEFGRYKIPADRKMKHLLSLITRLDMNAIITSHAKPRWVRGRGADGKEIATQDGMTFDCYGRLDYLFDLVLEVSLRGKKRVATVRKTRIKGFPEGETIDFSYEEIAKRYGREVLERDAIPQELATAEQVAELGRLVGVLKIEQQTVDKWLDKAEADSLAELPKATAQKCIDWCIQQVQAKAG